MHLSLRVGNTLPSSQSDGEPLRLTART
jgi:hypothetical protein